MRRLNFTNAYMWNDRMLGLAMTIRGAADTCHSHGERLVHGRWTRAPRACGAISSSLQRTQCWDKPVQKSARAPTVGATQYLPRIIGERLAREMIFFCARRFPAKEAAGGRPDKQMRAAERTCSRRR